MNPDKECPVCKAAFKMEELRDKGSYRISCIRCGRFEITRAAMEIFRTQNFTMRQYAIASSLMRQEEWRSLDIKDREWLFSTRDITVPEKTDKLLSLIAEHATRVGEKFNMDCARQALQARCWALDGIELRGLLDLLSEMKKVKTEAYIDGTLKVWILTQGWERLQQLTQPGSNSAQGLVTMCFANEVRPVYDNAIAPAIQYAGYEAMRVEREGHADKIDDEIIRQIRRSRFVVADGTGHRGSVYYEAGFAQGLGQKIFWTCRQDYAEGLHFDVRQYNCLLWTEDKLDEFKAALARRIEASLGRGPRQ